MSPRLAEPFSDVPVADASRPRTGGTSVTRWQARLLPLMSGMLVVLGAFFLIESVRQMHSLQSYIRDTSRFDLRVVPESPQVSPELRARLALEVYTLQQRERLANYMLTTRTWTRYMAFITGMVLALVGAAFVLGKLREQATKLDADAASVKFSLGTSSPGIVLATLGTILMLAAIVITFDVTGRWSPVYVPTDVEVIDDSSVEPPPPGGPPATPDAKARQRAGRGADSLPSYPGVIPSRP